MWYDLQCAWTALSFISKAALIAWVLATVTLPIVRWIWGDRGMRWGVSAGVLLQAATVLAMLRDIWDWQTIVLCALAIVGMGWAVEYVGSTTGFPFGRYHYTDRLQPQIGHVPLLIPVAWLMMLPPAWAVAAKVAGRGGIPFILVSALAFTAWDLFLDPQMVGWRLCIWERRGGYFGIPWVNFFGWALAAGTMTAIIRPDPTEICPLRLIYGLTWLLQTVGLGIIWKQPGPAVCGFLGMGAMVAWAWVTRQ